MTDSSSRTTSKGPIGRGIRRLWKWAKAVDASLDLLTVVIIVVMVVGALAIALFRCLP
jgi:hypothetical protein